MDIVDILLGAIMGGLAGYITNDIAINLLFEEKKILGIKFGGVVVKTREEFEKKMSALVQEEIINHNTLKESFLSEEFNEAIKKVFEDFFKENLSKNLSEKNLGDIHDFQKSILNIEEYLKTDLSSKIDSLIESTLKDITLEELVSKEQVDFSTDKLLCILKKIMNKEQISENFLNELYSEVKDKKICKLIGNEAFSMLEDTVSKNSSDILKVLKEYDEDIDSLIENFPDSAGLTKALQDFENELKEKTVEDILGKRKTDILSESIVEQLRRYILSDNGKDAIDNISEKLLNYLLNQDIKILEILKPGVKDRFVDFIEKKLPGIIEKIVAWVRKNNDRIEYAVESSIDEVIEENKVFKKYILEIIKKHTGNVVKRFDLIQSIINKINENKNDSTISKELSHSVLSYIEDNSLGEIIRKSSLTNKDITNYLYEEIKKNIDKIPGNIIPLGQFKLSELLPENTTSTIKKMTVKKVKDIKNEYLSNSAALENFLIAALDSLREKELRALITEESISKNSKNLSEKFENSITVKNKDRISDFCFSKTKEVRFDSFKSTQLNSQISDYIVKLSSNKFDELEKEPLLNYIELIKNNSKISKKSADTSVQLLTSNLENILGEKIKNTVFNNLKNMNNDDLKEMMKDFMGRELQPLNIMGAVLGVVIGTLMAFITPYSILDYFHLPYFTPEKFKFIGMDVVAYSAIGVVTNIIAIKGIFRPYNHSKILDIFSFGKFSQGVLCKEKPRFAKSMANFVRKELINENNLIKIVKENKPAIQENIVKKISADNYIIVHSVIDSESDKIYKGILEYSSKAINKNKEMISSTISDKFKYKTIEELQNELKIGSFRNKVLSVEASDILEKFKIQEFFSKESINFIKSDKKVKNFISDEKVLKSFVTEKIDSSLDSFIKENINNSKIKSLLIEQLKTNDSNFDKTIREILENLKLENPIDIFYEKLIDYEEIKTIINKKIKELFSKQLNPNKKIGELFDGAITTYLESNVEKFSNYFLEQSLNKLNDNKLNLEEFAVVEMNKHLKGNSGSIVSWFKEKANALIGGDELVRKVVRKSLFKTELILRESSEEIKEIIQSLIDDLNNTPLKTFDLELNNSTISSTVENIIDNEEFKRTSKEQIINVLNFIIDVPFKNYATSINIKDSKDLIALFQDDLDIFTKKLVVVIKENKYDSLTVPTSEIAMNITKNEILNLKLSVLTKDIPDDVIKNIISRFYSIVIKSPALEKNYKKLIIGLFDEVEKNDIFSIVNIDIFKEDFNTFLSSNFTDVNILMNTYSSNKKEIIEIIHELFSSLSPKSLDCISNNLISPFLDSTIENISDIFESLHIDTVTEKEIVEMDNRKLHVMFDSFAGKYFKQLELYGAMGAVFAIPILNFAALLLYFKETIKNKTNSK